MSNPLANTSPEIITIDDDSGDDLNVNIVPQTSFNTQINADGLQTDGDDFITRTAKRVFEVLMHDMPWDEELQKIFINGFRVDATDVENNHISPNMKAFLCKNHMNNLSISGQKFRFYADVGLVSELLKIKIPVVWKQKPVLGYCDTNKVFVHFNLERIEYTFYECVLHIVEYGYIAEESTNSQIITGTLQKLERQNNNRGTICISKRNNQFLDPNKEYSVYIKPNASGYEDLYHAITQVIEKNYLHEKIFGVPQFEHDTARFIQYREQGIAEMFAGNKTLNKDQREAVYSICKMHGDFPFILFGPPGTGKTTTLIEAIRHIKMEDPKSRFLVCTPSNAAADHFTIALLEAGFIDARRIYRSMSTRADFSTRDRRLDSVTLHDGHRFIIPSNGRKYFQYTVVISTIGNCARIRPSVLDFFSHILVDEAGQAAEPETWIPLGYFGHQHVKFVLAGDPMQLGPVLIDPVLEKPAYRFDQSLLVRLFGNSAYRSDPRLMVQLKNNYRSHAAIVQVSSTLFYNNSLIPTYPPGHDAFVGSPVLGSLRYPVLFHAVQGQEEGQLYFFNPDEISVAIRYVLTLLHPDHVPQLRPSDIGVVSPYREQAMRLSRMLPYDDLTVDTVERFQGSERKVIIITTTRTKKVGFLHDLRRVNTAITRAKQLLIIIGHPQLLCRDETWFLLIDCLLKNRCYVVEPQHFINNSEFGLANPQAQPAVV